MPLPSPSPSSTAVVTGASAGIGKDIARELAKRGHHLTLVARRTGPMEELAAELEQAHGTKSEVISCDLTDAAARDALVTDINGKGLTVEILINNAGFSNSGDFHTLDRHKEVAMVRTNIEAVVDLTGAWLPGMVARKRGAILNVASTASFQPIPGQASYAASKAFVLNFTEAVSAELKGTGVTVTALCPGPVKTEFAEVAGLESVENGTPDFVWAMPDDVARAGVEAMEKGRRVIVHGGINLAGSIAARVAPRTLLLPLLKRFYPVNH